MTQQDKDREAFEEWAKKQRHVPLDKYSDGTYREMEVTQAYKVWQVARDHYAPKLTADQATDVVYETQFKNGCEFPDSPHNIRRAEANFIVEALFAAGMKFKEEA